MIVMSNRGGGEESSVGIVNNYWMRLSAISKIIKAEVVLSEQPRP